MFLHKTRRISSTYKTCFIFVWASGTGSYFHWLYASVLPFGIC